MAQIRLFLRRFDLARDKAEKLHHDVLERHTYAVRARQLLERVKRALRG